MRISQEALRQPTLRKFLSFINYDRGRHGGEGDCTTFPEQQEFLKALCVENDFQTILEVGFNRGHSAELFLAYSNALVYSFDLGVHQVAQMGKRYLDHRFPNRLHLTLGDSRKTIPAFAAQKNIKMDLIFIDGGHQEEEALADLRNCWALAHKKTLLIMDDVAPKGFAGVSRAWNKIKKDGLVEQKAEISRLVGGSLSANFARGFAWGHYNFK